MRKDEVGWLSNMSGASPKKVVRDVSKMGLKRRTPAMRTASSKVTPSFNFLFIKWTMIKLSFTTTPDKAIIPKMEDW